IIHLAGENIAGKRWTKKQKKSIIDSRVKTSELLFSAIKDAKKKPDRIISASAIGYYGTKTTQHIYTEEDEAGSDFLADCVVQWEKSVDQFQELGIQVFKFRIGVVLSNQGGALQKMLKPIRAGFGAVLGSGKQYIPWIEISDLARIFLFAIEKKLTNSVYNAVAPDFITNRDFTKILANKLSRHLFLPNIPVFILKLFMGEMSSILLYGSRVSAKSITSEGFDFLYQKLDDIPISGK
ncbi:MAG: TIGR01777 family protein, partial [Bacteroidetes bacterium]|nr:TIGR01777 family protein [Bacteroidota bacterium]